MRCLLTPVLLTLGMLTLGLSLPTAEAASTLTLPVQVPLSGVQQAVGAQVPQEFARVDQTQTLLGGAVQVRVRGTVTRTAQVSVKADGDALLLSVPIRAAFRAEPGGMLAGLARDFGGAATVTLRLTPYITPNWDVGVRASAEHRWTDPLAVDLGRGMKLSVQALVDPQVRAQLDQLTARIERQVREQADLRRRAGTLWARAQRPWPLPTPAPAYARVKPLGLSVTPPRLTPDALKLDVGATLDLSAALGQPPAAGTPATGTPTPLPPLKVGPLQAAGIELSVPLALPYPELSALAARYVAGQTLTLPVPGGPVLRVTGVQVRPAGSRLRVTVQTRLDGPLGLSLGATTDVTGTPTVSADGRTVSLRDVGVQTRRDGLTGRALSWLADARAQAFLTRAARFDLGPLLDRARTQAQARLPFTPLPGVTLGGQVGTLTVQGLTVQPAALVVTARAAGRLQAQVNAGELVRGGESRAAASH